MSELSPGHGPRAEEELFPIRTVSAQTGVNPITLRAWERRYGLVNPRRTETGHRLYSQPDVDRIARAVSLLESGMSISEACNVIRRRTSLAGATQPSGEWQVYGKRLAGAVARFSEDDLNDILLKLMSAYPAHVVVDQLVLPALDKIRHVDTRQAAAHASFLAMYARNKFGARFHHRQRNPSGPVVLGVAFAGDGNEIALLSFGFAAHEAGFRPVLVGSPCRVDAIAHVARARRCSCIVLAAHTAPSDDIIESLAVAVGGSPVPYFALGAGAQAFGSAGIDVLDRNARTALAAIRQGIAGHARTPVASGQD